MERWHAHQRELKEGGATWCLACLEYGHLPEVCPYEDPLFVQAFDRGEVETAEEWIHLKAIPSPQVDQETCLTCLKGEEWCFAVGKVGHKPPDQPPPWQEVELAQEKVRRQRGGKERRKQREPRWCTMCIAYGHEDEDCPEQEPEDEEPERPAPEWEEPERPAPEWEEPERPVPEWEEPERPKPKREESVRPQPKRKELVRPQPKREESVRPQPKEGGVCASKALGSKLPPPPVAEQQELPLPPPLPPAEGECLLSGWIMEHRKPGKMLAPAWRGDVELHGGEAQELGRELGWLRSLKRTTVEDSRRVAGDARGQPRAVVKTGLQSKMEDEICRGASSTEEAPDSQCVQHREPEECVQQAERTG
ncbi:UNVERIFIED_CONTAM: hypothetical protein FKN15_074847 [Acipenser sinensis]